MNGNEDKRRFSVVLFWLAARMKAQGGQPQMIDTDFQRDYWDALNDIRIERIEWAAKHIFKTSIWFPMPKEIREASMLAPSTVLAAINLNQKALPEYTTYEDGAEKLQEIIDSLTGEMTV